MNGVCKRPRRHSGRKNTCAAIDGTCSDSLRTELQKQLAQLFDVFVSQDQPNVFLH